MPSYEMQAMFTAANAPLSRSSRVQIALDAARGLEYIHQHTRPSYIHRDIKSANVLLGKDCRAKVLIPRAPPILCRVPCNIALGYYASLI